MYQIKSDFENWYWVNEIKVFKAHILFMNIYQQIGLMLILIIENDMKIPWFETLINLDLYKYCTCFAYMQLCMKWPLLWLYNILAHAVTIVVYRPCSITVVAKLSTKSHSFDFIRPMLNILTLEFLLHREQR